MQNYKHVFVIGIDGAGRFVKDAETPFIDDIFSQGSLLYNAEAVFPTISAQCWGSILIGTEDAAKLTNQIVSETERNDPENPTFLKLIRNIDEDAKLASFTCWDPINNGIVEHDIGVDFHAAGDPELADVAYEYIKKNKPKAMFIQFDNVDAAGHSFGYGTEKYLQSITEADTQVNRVYQAIKEAELENVLFIIVADHGGNDTKGHGGWTDNERLVIFGIAGHSIKKDVKIGVSIRDIPSFVYHALGMDIPDNIKTTLTDIKIRSFFKDAM